MVELSVVIPVWNQQGPLGRGIQQFRTRNADPGIEVVVVDGGSYDGSLTVAGLLADRVVSIHPAGESWKLQAWQAGASVARGTILLFAEPESRLRTPPKELARQLSEVFSRKPSVLSVLFPPESTESAVPVGGNGSSRSLLAVEKRGFLEQCRNWDPARRSLPDFVADLRRSGLSLILDGAVGVSAIVATDREPQEV